MTHYADGIQIKSKLYFCKKSFQKTKANVGPIDTMKSTRRLRNLNVCRATASVPLNLVFAAIPAAIPHAALNPLTTHDLRLTRRTTASKHVK